MTCPHCGANAREQVRFCPSCSRLLSSPLLRAGQDDEGRAGARRERASRAPSMAGALALLPVAGAPFPTRPLTEAKLARLEAKRARREAKRARLEAKRARLAARAPSMSGLPRFTPPPLATAREVHTSARHDTVVDDTLQQALRGQAAGAAAALSDARQARPSPQPAETPAQAQRPPKQKRQKGERKGQPPARPQPPAAETRSAEAARGGPTPAVFVLLLFNAATLFALYLGVNALETMPAASIGNAIAGPARFAGYAIGGIIALASLGLLALAPFGRSLQRFTSLFWLPVFPFGTLMAFVTLLYLGGRGMRLLFSGRAPSQLTSAESTQLARTRRFAPLMALVLLVLCGMSLLSVVGAAAGLAPALSQPGSISDLTQAFSTDPGPTQAPEDPTEAVLSELEAYAVAQVAYAEANGGYYDRTECLVAAAECVPGAPARRVVLDERYRSPDRLGHEFRLRLGPPAPERGSTVSATSVISFALLAVPIGSTTSTTGYCVNQTLAVCRFDASVPVDAPPGECPAECTFVR